MTPCCLWTTVKYKQLKVYLISNLLRILMFDLFFIRQIKYVCLLNYVFLKRNYFVCALDETQDSWANLLANTEKIWKKKSNNFFFFKRFNFVPQDFCTDFCSNDKNKCKWNVLTTCRLITCLDIRKIQYETGRFWTGVNFQFKNAYKCVLLLNIWMIVSGVSCISNNFSK